MSLRPIAEMEAPVELRLQLLATERTACYNCYNMSVV